MSVSILVFKGEVLSRDIPVATEILFRDYWDPIIRELHLPLLIKWNGYLEVRRDDAFKLILEMEAVLSVLRDRIHDENREYLITRTEEAITIFREYASDSTVDRFTFG